MGPIDVGFVLCPREWCAGLEFQGLGIRLFVCPQCQNLHMKSPITRISLHVLVISTFGEMFMKLIINIARMLVLIAEMDSAGSKYPGAVPWRCLATPRPPLMSNYDAFLEGD